jgi:hypothetical protein
MPNSPLRTLLALVLLLASAASRADGFAFRVAEPGFRVSIPGLPQIEMQAHAADAAQPHLRFLGSDGFFTVAIFTPAANAGIKPVECAVAALRSLAARPGVPPLPQIYRAQVDPNTYMALYATRLGVAATLHAHFFSAAGGTHCVEVNVSMVSTSEEDLKLWQANMEKGRIDPE